MAEKKTKKERSGPSAILQDFMSWGRLTDLEKYNLKGYIFNKHASIHLSIHLHRLISGRVAEVAVPAGFPKLPFSRPHQPALTGGLQGVPRPVWRYSPSTWSSVCPVASSQLTRCPNHLNWLLSTQRSSGSTPSPSRMAELLTLSLRGDPS